jgi:heme/copper-type cytochrome/quinol oxidase subunit 2
MNEDTKRNLFIGGAALLSILITGAICYAFFAFPNAAPITRDILIIILAIESIVVFVFLGLMIWQLYQLIKLLREEVIPLINTTKDTVEQVKHTTTFVGQSVAAPVISVSGFLAGAKAMIDTARGNRPPESILRKEERTDG